MGKLMSYAFAVDGDRDTVADTSTTTVVNYQYGYTSAYELANTEAGYRYVDRATFNQVLYDVTLNQKDWQQYGAPDYYSALIYQKYAVVYDQDLSDYYINLTADNADGPSVSGWMLYSSWVASLSSGYSSYAEDSGAANAYVLSAVSGRPAPSALFDGMEVVFTPANSNTGTCTVNAFSLGALSLVDATGSNLSSGNITSGYPIKIIYNASNTQWRLVTSPASVTAGYTDKALPVSAAGVKALTDFFGLSSATQTYDYSSENDNSVLDNLPFGMSTVSMNLPDGLTSRSYRCIKYGPDSNYIIIAIAGGTYSVTQSFVYYGTTSEWVQFGSTRQSIFSGSLTSGTSALSFPGTDFDMLELHFTNNSGSGRFIKYIEPNFINTSSGTPYTYTDLSTLDYIYFTSSTTATVGFSQGGSSSSVLTQIVGIKFGGMQ